MGAVCAPDSPPIDKCPTKRYTAARQDESRARHSPDDATDQGRRDRPCRRRHAHRDRHRDSGVGNARKAHRHRRIRQADVVANIAMTNAGAARRPMPRASHWPNSASRRPRATHKRTMIHFRGKPGTAPRAGGIARPHGRLAAVASMPPWGCFPPVSRLQGAFPRSSPKIRCIPGWLLVATVNNGAGIIVCVWAQMYGRR